MLFIVLVGLLISLLIVSAMVLLAFFDVARAGPPQSLTASPKWQPPLVQDDTLLAWASEMASTATARRLAGPRGENTAKQLVAEIHEGSTYAIAQSPDATVRMEPNCSNGRHRMIGVTPPEALVIAEEIRSTKSRREVNRIHDRAARNAAKVVDMTHQRYAQGGLTCPLLAQDETCTVFGVRPMRCRGWCLASGKDGDVCLPGDGDASKGLHAKTVTSGAEDGLCRAIESAGLDANVYELNSALVAALDAPVGAERWAEGERVFEQCKRYE